jgi:hypothetical protein
MRILAAAVALVLSVPARAGDDVSAILKQRTQALYDALAPGDAKVWDDDLDPGALVTDESGAFTRKAETVAQVAPLPKGLSGSIAVTDWQIAIHGDVAVAAFVADEHENYHGQQLHALYRSTMTWLKEAAGWKVIALQTIALQQDPPAIRLAPAAADAYVGRYAAGPDFVYDIARSGDGLTGNIAGGKASPLCFEIRDVAFTPGQPRVRKIFTRDARGRIDGFLSRRDGRDVVWKRIE